MSDKPNKPGMDFREKLAFMVVALVVMVFVMIYFKPELTTNDGFMLLAQAIVISALIGGVIAWAYSQAKGTDDTNAVMAKQADALAKSSDPAWAAPRQPGETDDATIYADRATVIAADDPKANR